MVATDRTVLGLGKGQLGGTQAVLVLDEDGARTAARALPRRILQVSGSSTEDGDLRER